MQKVKQIRDQIEKIEEAYEYMLAYAAQGRAEEGAGADGAQIRTFLKQFSAALTALEEATSLIIDENPAAGGFIEVFISESKVMASILLVLLARENLSSEVIDNTNGLISVRAYLTSLFFLDKSVL
ncbi:MAG TPA: hypothetical protein EYQ26_00540 [Rhodospirillales bacterium]|jgi:hypothetical protein|nr:hypothetical protein [Rhodospirillales bacterium]HIL75221.1 hypothetical protein [Rhodospirillales bacterium]